jgi:hypothetical protein
MDARLTGQTASNLQSIRISEYDHGDCQWITRHTMANWVSFRELVRFRVRTFGGKVAGLHPHHVY